VVDSERRLTGDVAIENIRELMMLHAARTR
jgi:hypothetical protein